MIAEILRELIAAGLQGESLVAAVERIEQAQPKATDATAERRRAKDRERYHLRKPQKTPTPPKSTEIVEMALSSTSSVVSDTKILESKKERVRKSQLPADWVPKPRHYEKAKKFKHPDGFVDLKADAMRSWAASKAVMRANWDATFDGFLEPKEGTNGQRGSRSFQDDTKSVSAALGRLAEATERGEYQLRPRPSLLPASGQSDLRLLPKG
jgi:hypothetical protein